MAWAPLPPEVVNGVGGRGFARAEARATAPSMQGRSLAGVDVPGLEAEKVGEQVKAELHNKKGFCWLAKFGISTGSGLLAFCWFKMAKMASCKKNCAATGNRGDCDGSCALVRL